MHLVQPVDRHGVVTLVIVEPLSKPGSTMRFCALAVPTFCSRNAPQANDANSVARKTTWIRKLVPPEAKAATDFYIIVGAAVVALSPVKEGLLKNS